MFDSSARLLATSVLHVSLYDKFVFPGDETSYDCFLGPLVPWHVRAEYVSFSGFACIFSAAEKADLVLLSMHLSWKFAEWCNCNHHNDSSNISFVQY